MSRHKGNKNHRVGIEAQVYQNEAHEKVENTKIYAFFKVKKKEVYWHKGNKNHRVGIDAQVYQNEAHEKVKNIKICGIFRDFFLGIVYHYQK